MCSLFRPSVSNGHAFDPRNRAAMAVFSTDFLESRLHFGFSDFSYGNGGFITTDIGTSSTDTVFDVAIQPDFKSVVVGSTGNDFAIARYSSDSSLDEAFDTDGKLVLNLGGTDIAHGVAVQPDAKIVVVGESAGNWALTRLNEDGSLDTTFDSDGKVFTDLGASIDTAWSVVLDPATNKIYAAGIGGDTGGNPYVVICRYNTNGSLDTSWDGDGKKYTGFASDNCAYSIQLDGKVVIAGKLNGNFLIARYNTNGTFDTSFDGDGRQSVDFGTSSDSGYGLAVQSDGKLVVAGVKGTGSSGQFALARLNTNGSLDSTFGSSGTVTTSFTGGNAAAYDVRVLADGRIVAVGGANSDFAIAKYNSNGTLDTTFDTDGLATLDLGATEFIRAGDIDGEGVLTVAGSSGSDFAHSRAYVDRLVAATAPSASSTAPSTLLLNWSDGNLGESSWRVERDASSTFPAPESILTGKMYEAEWLDGELEEGHIYYYRLTALSPSTSSSVSSAFAGIAGPQNAGSFFIANGVNALDRVLTWDQPSIASYGAVELERSTASDFSQNLTTISVSSGAITVTDTLPAAGDYYYRIRRVGSGTNALTGLTISAASEYEYVSTSDTASRNTVTAPITLVRDDLYSRSGVSDLAPDGSRYILVGDGNSLHFSGVGTNTNTQQNKSWFANQTDESVRPQADINWSITTTPGGTNVVSYRGYNAAHIFSGVGNQYKIAMNITPAGGTLLQPVSGQAETATVYVRVVANARDSANRTIYVAGDQDTGAHSESDFTPTGPTQTPPDPERGLLDAKPIKLRDLQRFCFKRGFTQDFKILFKRNRTFNFQLRNPYSGGSGTADVAFQPFRLTNIGSGGVSSPAFTNVLISAYGSGALPLPTFDLRAGTTFSALEYAANGNNQFIDINSIRMLGSLAISADKKTINPRGQVLNPRGSVLSISSVKYDHVNFGVNTNHSSLNGFLIQNVETVSSPNSSELGPTGNYFAYLAGGSNVFINKCKTGDTLQKDHNMRLFADRLTIADCDLRNVTDWSRFIGQLDKDHLDDGNTSGADRKGMHTIRLNDGDYIWATGNRITGGQIYVGKFERGNNTTFSDGIVKYFVFERNRVLADSNETNADFIRQPEATPGTTGAYSYKINDARIFINVKGNSSGAKFGVLRNNLIESTNSPYGVVQMRVNDDANYKFLQNTIRYRGDVGTPDSFLRLERLGTGDGDCAIYGNLFAEAPNGTKAVRLSGTNALAAITTGSTVLKGHNVFDSASAYMVGTSTPTLSSWNALGGSADFEAEATIARLTAVPTLVSGAIERNFDVVGVIDDFDGGTARPTTGRTAGAYEL